MRFTELEYILIFIECASSLFVFYFLYKFLHVHSVPACMMMHVGVAEESAVNNPQFSATVLSLSLSQFSFCGGLCTRISILVNFIFCCTWTTLISNFCVLFLIYKFENWSLIISNGAF
jgi:hypothetical protein